MKSIIVLLALLVTGSLAHAASCGPFEFTDSKAVRTGGESVLIVTHPSTQWDGRFSSKVGMDATVKFAKARHIPVIYLQDRNISDTGQSYFFADCRPDYWVSSNGGEFSFDVTATHVYSVGGHWELCQAGTMNDLMSSWARQPAVDRTLTQVMDGIYTAGYSFHASDPYYSAYQLFMSIVTYGRPSAWPFPKLTLLESMGIIREEARQVEFIKRLLPPYSKLSQNYQVELYLNGKKEEVIRQGLGERPPVLKLEYVNSVLTTGSWIPSLH